MGAVPDARGHAPVTDVASSPGAPPRSASVASAAQSRSAPAPRPADLRRTLERGMPDEILAALHALAPAPITGIEALIERLDDAAQRDALQALQRARWGRGDLDGALQAVRGAFASGPRWRRSRSAHGDDPLPPLYPER
jgi:hypothetical protein